MLKVCWRTDERMEPKFLGGRGGDLGLGHRHVGTIFTYMPMTFFFFLNVCKRNGLNSRIAFLTPHRIVIISTTYWYYWKNSIMKMCWRAVILNL